MTTSGRSRIPQHRIPQHRVAESIAGELRARILADDDGSYRLPTQDQLVQEFGVSYPSVREAIRILETEGATVRYLISSLVALWLAQEETPAVAAARRLRPSLTEADSVVGDHRRITQAIAAGNAEEARRLTRAHLAASQALLLDHLDDGIVRAASAKARQSLTSTSDSRI